MPINRSSRGNHHRLWTGVSLVCLALLATESLWDEGAPLHALDVFTLGVIFGALTGVAVLLRRQWRLDGGSDERTADRGLWVEALKRGSRPRG